MSKEYIKKQNEYNFKIGDSVRITEKIFNHDDDGNGLLGIDDGWDNSWDDMMDLTVGCTGTITDICGDNGIAIIVEEVPWKDFGFGGTPYFSYPYWVLEKVQEVNLKDYNIKCSRCGAPAYQGLFSIECSKNC